MSEISTKENTIINIKTQTSSENLSELFASLAKAQGEINPVIKNATNPFFKSKYADLASVIDAIRQPFSANGLSYYQAYRTIADKLYIVTRINHGSGEWIEDGGVPLIITKNDMQGLGSASTYARRYGLMAAAGIAPEDDDGNSACKDKTPQEVKQQLLDNGSQQNKKRTSTDLITNMQLKIAQDLIQNHTVDINACYKYFNINNLNEMPGSRFNEFIKMVGKKPIKKDNNQ